MNEIMEEYDTKLIEKVYSKRLEAQKQNATIIFEKLDEILHQYIKSKDLIELKNNIDKNCNLFV